jgi:hypothetical protein
MLKMKVQNMKIPQNSNPCHFTGFYGATSQIKKKYWSLSCGKHVGEIITVEDATIYGHIVNYQFVVFVISSNIFRHRFAGRIVLLYICRRMCSLVEETFSETLTHNEMTCLVV